MYFSFDSTGRVMIVAPEKVYPDMMELEPPGGFAVENQADWRYLGGWIYDPLPVKTYGATLENRVEDVESKTNELEEALELILSGVTE